MNTPLPPLWLPHNLYKNISNSTNIPVFWILLPPHICKCGGSSNYVFVPFQKTEYLDTEGFFDTEFGRTGTPNTNI